MARVKICGLSTPETMQAALDHGADMVGLVFFAKSPRNVSLAQAKSLATQARDKAKIVALVVDAQDEFLSMIAHELKPDFIQFHGNESPQRMADMQTLVRVPLIKAIKVESALDVASAQAYSAASLILYDAKASKDELPGGNGLAFDWKLLADVQGEFMLAGGLNVDNVRAAIQLTKAPIVDVSSGVESSTGVKDVHLIAKFIKAAKSL
jgi:phosphoribosylanthranilate isomerase